MAGLLSGKTALVMGVLNKNSLAFGIARALHAAGAGIVFTYQNEELWKRVEPLAEELEAATFMCDVSLDSDIALLGQHLKQSSLKLDTVVHSLAFAPREALAGRFNEVTTREAFRVALDVSAYSLIGVVRELKPLLNPGASIMTLTYIGSQVVIPNYNVMGVAKAALEASIRYLAADLGPEGFRVNAISSGPQQTLAARGISGFQAMHSSNPPRTALKRNVEKEDVGNLALFLASDLSKNITGQTLYVDAGQSIIGLPDSSQ